MADEFAHACIMEHDILGRVWPLLWTRKAQTFGTCAISFQMPTQDLFWTLNGLPGGLKSCGIFAQKSLWMIVISSNIDPDFLSISLFSQRLTLETKKNGTISIGWFQMKHQPFTDITYHILLAWLVNKVTSF